MLNNLEYLSSENTYKTVSIKRSKKQLVCFTVNNWDGTAGGGGGGVKKLGKTAPKKIQYYSKYNTSPATSA